MALLRRAQTSNRVALVESNEQIEDVYEINRSLELRIDRRTADLEAANRELAAFAYSVSHDLRTPLRALDGLSQALLEDYSDVLDETGQDYLKRIRGASQRMGRLIDDMLKLSRLNRGELQRGEVDLAEVAREHLDQYRQVEPERVVELVAPESLMISGDPRLLRIAIDNLISNAWKFTRTREVGRIEVGVSTEGDSPVYFVKDNGVGFDMTYAGNLFGAFQRLHSAATFEGSGIGLATVQRVIARHGGTIRAESVEGQGATFFFTLDGGVS
jgi:signal transduction histidine kinase